MSLREQNQKTLFQHLQAEDAHDLAGTLATVHPEALFEDQPLGMVLRGRDEVSRHYNLWWQAFGVRTVGGSLHWVSDDFVIGESHFVGQHVGEFLGIKPTGRQIRLPMTVFVNFRDGLLSGERFYYDLNTIMMQLGEQCFPTLTTVSS